LEVLRIEDSIVLTSLTPSIFGANLVDATTTASSAFHAWISWQKVKRRYFEDELDDKQLFRATYFLRAAHVWKGICEWCLSDSSGSVGARILKSLEGVQGKHWTDWPEELRLRKNLHACHALFAFCGGQESPAIPDSMFDIICSAFDGLMGGYHGCGYYSCAHLVCVPVKHLKRILHWL
jgi:hypothetical protein